MQPQDIVTSLNTFCDTNHIPRFIFDRKRNKRLQNICASSKFELNSVKITWNDFNTIVNGSWYTEHKLNCKFSELATQTIPGNALPFVSGVKSKKITLLFSREQNTIFRGISVSHIPP